MISLLAAVALAIPAEIGDTNVVRALDTIEIDFAALPESRSSFVVRMTALGDKTSATAESALVLRTIVTDDRVVLEDEWRIMGRDFHVRQECARAATLPLRSGTWSMTRRDSTRTAEIVVSDGMARTVSQGRTQDIPYPEGTVNQAALFRIIPQLPRDPGVSYVFDAYSEAIQIQARVAEQGAPYHVNCAGPEIIDIGGRSVPCTKYTVFESRSVDYYVDGAGTLRRVVADGGQTVIDRR